MIIREWRGRAAIANAAAYPEHFRNNVAHELKQVQGFLGAHLSQRRVGDKIEFLVLTKWQSAYSDEVGRGFRAKAATDSNRSRPGVPMIPATFWALLSCQCSHQYI